MSPCILFSEMPSWMGRGPRTDATDRADGPIYMRGSGADNARSIWKLIPLESSTPTKHTRAHTHMLKPTKPKRNGGKGGEGVGQRTSIWKLSPLESTNQKGECVAKLALVSTCCVCVLNIYLFFCVC